MAELGAGAEKEGGVVALLAEEPERRVGDLMEKYRGEVGSLRAALGASLGSHDDIFLLRYVLSFPLLSDAEAAVRWALQWRADPRHAYWLERAERKEQALAKLNDDSSGLKVNISAYHAGLRDGGPLQIVRPGLVDFGPMLDLHDHERMVMFHVMQKEVAWRMCDRRTRETGRLVKLVVINDFTAMRMSMPPRKVMQSYSESSKIAERLYPQMLQTTVCCNPPTWFSMVMRVGKLFLSQKTLDKFKICPGTGTIQDCPFVRRYLNIDQIPSFLGGPCRCEHQGGCVPGMPNDASKCRTLTKEEIDILKSQSAKDAIEETQNIEEFVKAYGKLSLGPEEDKKPV